MEVDRDLKAALTAGMAKKNKKKDKKKKRKMKAVNVDSDQQHDSEGQDDQDDQDDQDEENEYEDVKEQAEVTEDQDPQNLQEQKQDTLAEEGEIKSAPKKKKKKKKIAKAYNLGGDDAQKKNQGEEKKDMVFDVVSEEEMRLQTENFAFKCSSCPFGTDDNSIYRGHFKGDWHKFNAQRKSKLELPVTEEQFKEYLILKDFV